MPKLPQKRQPQSSPPTVTMAVLLIIVCFGGFFGLMSMVFPGAGMLGLALIILGLLFVAQYYIWGRWIYAWAVRKEAEADAKRAAEEAAQEGDGREAPG